ncbi:hypothetical protein ACWDZX_31615, partial [Streptomyces collinus]
MSDEPQPQQQGKGGAPEEPLPAEGPGEPTGSTDANADPAERAADPAGATPRAGSPGDPSVPAARTGRL